MNASRTDTVTLADKVAHLSRPESYVEGTSAVETIETHLSYVFLTDRHAYKFKKPVHDRFHDLASLEARRFNCEEEVRLNRRLARNVYLGVVALTAVPAALVLEGLGEPVEWLVKMRRLPRHLMLDAAMKERRVGEQDIMRFTAALADFYRSAERAPLSPAAYRARFERTILENRAALAKRRYGLERALVGKITAAQLAFLDRNAQQLGLRVHALVEGHGDLRPEHVCLSEPPVFIDCLEFDRDLRIVDPADEVGYLAMECLFVGQSSVAESILHAYRATTGDCVEQSLVRFHQACRAVTRAKLAAWHLDDVLPNGGREKWVAQARDYLQLAAYLLFNPAGAPPPSRLRAYA